LPSSNGQPQNFATAVADVSDRVTALVRDEIALAKAEVSQKAISIGKGAAAVAAGAVFGVFAVIFGLETLAWGLNDIFVSGAGNLWIGFAIVFGVLLVLTLFAFMFAWRKLRVGAPAPTMAIEEAKRIRETVAKPEAGD
jgi:putative superfamily III holin-X